MDGGRGGPRAGGGGLEIRAVKVEAGVTVGAAQGWGAGGVGSTAAGAMTQAAHFGGGTLRSGWPSASTLMTCWPSAEHSTSIRPGPAAAMAA